MKEIFHNVFRDEQGILTRNLVKGVRVYGEKLVDHQGEEYRVWNPYRSKLASAIMCGLESLPIDQDSKVLYLGSATGTTVSHVSDIATRGTIYCVEFAPRSMRDFLPLAEARDNIIPILGNAKDPQQYAPLLETVDLIYQDVAQVEQAEILLRNLPFLKRGGYVMLCIKARSIDVTKDPEKVFRQEISKLRERVDIRGSIDISNYEKDHSFVVGVKT
ncbi:MAG TPA: fibrillarin-like rRNA/tRNA 2'-O-methyltransferase [Candidatus Methanofastidiosa archaeon]|nr:fibrillarin-like rRNA/tRNA 2'-O-methyltransferase [Candidatus Methanofastidiosa archaeon]